MKIKANINLEQSFEKLKEKWTKTTQAAEDGYIKSYFDLREAIDTHLSECTEQDPDDLKEVLQPIGDRNLND